jgi:hypothetical protein
MNLDFDITKNDRELWERILDAIYSAQVPDTSKYEDSIIRSLWMSRPCVA